jgi:hypothetical protein
VVIGGLVGVATCQAAELEVTSPVDHQIVQRTTRTTGTLGYAAASIIGSMYQFPLAAGFDRGVKSIETLTTSVNMTSGTACIRIMRRVASLPVIANVGFKYDAFDLGMPLISNDAALMVGVQAASTTSGPLQMELVLAKG